MATIAFDKFVVLGTVLSLFSSCGSRFAISWSTASTGLIAITRVIYSSIGPIRAVRETNIVGSLPALMFVAMPRDGRVEGPVVSGWWASGIRAGIRIPRNTIRGSFQG